MSRLTLHVTDLDGFRWYRKIESMTADDMVARLMRTSEPNESMLMGTAFHSVLENPPDIIDTVERGGFTFAIDCDAEIELPQTREIRAEKTYIVDGVEVTLTGKCDGITANRVDDHKLTFKPNPENYMDAFQWPAYLDIFNADSFRYIVYSARKKGSLVTIYDVSPITMYRYPGMEKHLICGISDVLWFVKEHAPQMIT